MSKRWEAGARLLDRIRSSPPLLALIVVVAVVVGVGTGLVVRGQLIRPAPTEAPEDQPQDDPDGFAEWLLGGGEDAPVVDQYLQAERAIREQLAKQAQLEAQGDDRARVLRGLGAVAQPWTWLGPRNFGGRTRALVINPADPNVMLAGGITGGVWRSEDRGGSWAPMTDTFSNVSIGVLEIDPSNPQVVYAGTGEAYYRPRTLHRGNGIMKSTDGGTSWAFLQSTTENDAFDWVGDVEVSHNDPNRVYAATGTGVWVSSDGGVSWGAAPVLPAGEGQRSVGCMELAIRTDRVPDVVFASCGYEGQPIGVFRSTDAGQTWDRVLPSDDERIGFAALAIAPSNQDIMYASVSDTREHARGLFRSTSGGEPGSWEVRASPRSGSPDWLDNCTAANHAQGGYDNALAIDPVDPNRLWVGGIDLFRSDDGGATLQVASDWAGDVDAPSYTHADQHVILFDPGYDGATNRTVHFGNDGGLYRTENDRADLSGSTCNNIQGIEYQSRNVGYGTTQFVGGSVSDDGAIAIGGTQDNGTYRFDAGGSSDWRSIRGGDGGNTAIHPTGEWLLVSYYGFDFARLTGAARTGESARCNDYHATDECADAASGIVDEGEFYPPIERDPTTPSVLWTGATQMWRTSDIGASWVAAGDVLGSGFASAIGIAPSDSNTVYVGTAAGLVMRSTDALAAAPAWTPLDASFPARKVTSIAVSATDPSTVYVAFKTFEGEQLWRSIGGGPFEAIDASLPDAPVNAVAINPKNPLMVYVGTDVGVFESLDGGLTWRVANENLATTIVSRLVFRKGSSELYAFTFGRGAYRVDVGDRSPPVNDLISTPKDVVLAPDYRDTVDIRSASIASDDPALSCGSSLAPAQTRSVWYRFQDSQGGRIAVTTEGSTFDTVVAVHAADAAGKLTEIECNDESVAALGPSSLVFEAAAGTTYYIEVTRSASSPTDTLANTLQLRISRA